MSRAQDGRGMETSPGPAGSVRRARERLEAGMPREVPGPIPRLPIRNPNNGASKPPLPAILQARDRNIGMAISKPTPIPQWPLSGPIASPVSSNGSDYQPPRGRSPPQRPPRPDRVPSILDGSRVQEPTPVFLNSPHNARISELSIPETPGTMSSRPTTESSVGSIPDFPLPTNPTTREPPRRSMNLGPPPSSRRGNSSFYSTASYVSPIPEESPRTRSQISYASSAAIPDSFGSLSPAYSQDDGNYVYDFIAEESPYSSDEEVELVRSASIGRKGKPSLVTTKSSERGEIVPFVLPIRPGATPIQQDTGSPFEGGTGYIDSSEESSSAPSYSNQIPQVGAAITTDRMLGAFEAASAPDPAALRAVATSPNVYRVSTSALRRLPRLDIDAVRKAEAHGSLTSLPDLIRRATRLASMIDKGRRPASRFDDMGIPPEFYARDRDSKGVAFSQDTRHQSGLSDMLAAFPPPAQANTRRSIRQTIRQSTNSWPLPLGRRSMTVPPAGLDEKGAMSPGMEERGSEEKQKRRYCGLPLWGFLLLLFVLVLIIAAAIIVPVEFFVVQKKAPTTSTAQPDTSTCQSQLQCQNGGTNVVTDGVCSCICTNGFTGSTCTVNSSQGCTSTDLSSTDNTLRNVTLGEAIPRLIQEGQTNFSLPLSATNILSKFNAGNLSCVAENALVTFNGQTTRTTSAEVLNGAQVDNDLVRAGNAVPVTISILPDVSITLTLDSSATGAFTVVISTLTEPLATSGLSLTTIFATTITGGAASASPSSTTTTTTTRTTTEIASLTTSTSTSTTSTTSTPTITTTSAATTSTITSAAASATFAVTNQVLDFGRVAVLAVLQAQVLQNAVTAQSSLQQFFTTASGTGTTNDAARNVTIGNGNTVDLVNLKINFG